MEDHGLTISVRIEHEATLTVMELNAIVTLTTFKVKEMRKAMNEFPSNFPSDEVELVSILESAVKKLQRVMNLGGMGN